MIHGDGSSVSNRCIPDPLSKDAPFFEVCDILN